ncbi:hypothetical protein COM13_11800 [Bacillus pseudomycoides]|uniref:Uncharacterized protein n=1 Tax=Bacillus pseudomycoides TaxID=64104 RepID=A0A2C3UBW9_9BACI|nr:MULTISPECIES: hypothetical protein [Bacillus]PDY02519.1 hypothetical protein COO07_00720 [Bacillus pseudomycoides]PED05847.1 hypothetical protein COO19_24170 [Bacillus pseudomycoides]PEF75548.1 hypothetical protein CON94_09840 [Bacillus pseudomycoides]PEI98662.1 hypothetical protein CN686_04635 [Bacillus pseudomycoides]PEK26060.1 hypothetical protein CN693_09620 [Bacillus pseudomycoides]
MKTVTSRYCKEFLLKGADERAFLTLQWNVDIILHVTLPPQNLAKARKLVREELSVKARLVRDNNQWG